MAFELRGSSDDLLHRAVRVGLPRLRADLSAQDRFLPRAAEREVENFLACGQADKGFAWLQCGDCAHNVLVPFSCKGRGFCPACCGRRMAERAASLVERVVPHVGTRQWVLTLPFRRRWLLARRPELLRGVLSVALDHIERWYRSAVAAPHGRSGAVTAIQRFGSSLALNPHFHILHLDGVYVRARDGSPLFRQATPHQDDVEHLVQRIAVGAERWLAKRGYGPDDDAEEPDQDDGLALIEQASLGGLQTTGRDAGRPVLRIRTIGGREVPLPPRCASCDGYNLHAGVSLKAGQREQLERLLRYLFRPPLAKARLSEDATGRVVMGMKRTWSDGTTSVSFTPAELVARLVAIVPPARKGPVRATSTSSACGAWSDRAPRPSSSSCSTRKPCRWWPRRQASTSWGYSSRHQTEAPPGSRACGSPGPGFPRGSRPQQGRSGSAEG